MNKKIINTIIILLLILPLATKAETVEERIANENVVRDAQIFLSLNTFDASSSMGIIDIVVDPGSQSMNASGVILNFATSSIEIKGILTGSSFCRFFLDNSFDNNLGELKLSGMKPYPGESMKSLFGQIIFEKIDTGTSTLSFVQNKSEVLANNGFATNVLATTSDLVL